MISQRCNCYSLVTKITKLEIPVTKSGVFYKVPVENGVRKIQFGQIWFQFILCHC